MIHHNMWLGVRPSIISDLVGFVYHKNSDLSVYFYLNACLRHYLLLDIRTIPSYFILYYPYYLEIVWRLASTLLDKTNNLFVLLNSPFEAIESHFHVTT